MGGNRILRRRHDCSDTISAAPPAMAGRRDNRPAVWSQGPRRVVPCFQMLSLEARSKCDPAPTRPQWTHERPGNMLPQTAAETWHHRYPNRPGACHWPFGRQTPNRIALPDIQSATVTTASLFYHLRADPIAAVGEYGDDPTTTAPPDANQYDPMWKSYNYQGTIKGQQSTVRWANTIEGGTRGVYHDHDGAANEEDHHYGDHGTATPPVKDPENTGDGTAGAVTLDQRYVRSEVWTVKCDDPSTPAGSEKWTVSGTKSGVCVKATTGVAYSSGASGGVSFTITGGATAFAKDDSFKFWTTKPDTRIVAQCGADEMPATKLWKMLLLASCYSGDYYCNVFNHETLFFTYPEISGIGVQQAYIRAILDGKTRQKICEALNGTEADAYDWWKY